MYNNGLVIDPVQSLCYFLSEKSLLLVSSWKKTYLKSLRFVDEFTMFSQNDSKNK
jgi:hypothetical protein